MSEEKKRTRRKKKPEEVIPQMNFHFRISSKDLEKEKLTKKEIKAFFDEMTRLKKEGKSPNDFGKIAVAKTLSERRKIVPMEANHGFTDSDEEGFLWKMLLKKVKEIGLEETVRMLNSGTFVPSTPVKSEPEPVVQVVETNDEQEKLLQQLKEMQEKMKQMKEEKNQSSTKNQIDKPKNEETEESDPDQNIGGEVSDQEVTEDMMSDFD